MRIVGGVFKGRVLLEFKGKDIRPTSDMARESLFNIIKNKIVGADFLDLFCGTGAVGIEALSRGAKSVVFNDFSRESISISKKNLEKVDKEKISNVTNAIFKNFDARRYLESVSEKFDIIFIDAPYNSDFIEDILSLSSKALKEGGIIIFEDEKKVEYSNKDLIDYDVRKYGRAVFTFFKKA